MPRQSAPEKITASLPPVQPGDLYIQLRDRERDEFGRRSFTIFWYEKDRTGRPDGYPPVGGQCYYADERPYIADVLDLGGRVFYWPSGQEITGALFSKLEEE